MKPFLIAVFVFATSLNPIPVSANADGACPVTLGSDEVFGAPFPKGRNWYGSESLAVQLPNDGIWPTTKTGHSIAVKLFWWSVGFKPGMEQSLRVEISSLDGKPVRAKIGNPTNAYAASLGGWTMLTGIDFPDQGCWQISAEYLGQTLTFVVKTIDR